MLSSLICAVRGEGSAIPLAAVEDGALPLVILFVFCRKNVERRYLLENMEGVFLVVDEIIDGG